MPKQSFIGTTGYTSQEEILKVVGRDPTKWKNLIQVGVLVSSKTLAGLPVEQAKRYPKREALRNIFPDLPHTLNMLHFNTNRREQLCDDLIDAHELVGPNCNGFQLNIAWPDLKMIEQYRAIYPNATIVLQCGTRALEELVDMETDLPHRVAEYGQLIDYVLIDQSGGKGMVFDYEFVHKAFERLKDLTDIGLALAGGLRAENLYRLQMVWHKFKDFSIDAESGIRDERDDLNVSQALMYLKIADAVFEKRRSVYNV